MEMNNLPRHISYKNSKYLYDKKYIYISSNEINSSIKSAIHGKIISSLIFPLIFDKKCNCPEIDCRSIEFFYEVMNNNKLYYDLSSDLKLFFHI